VKNLVEIYTLLLTKKKKMEPPKVDGPKEFARVTQKIGKKKERIVVSEKHRRGAGCYNTRD
jgi:hypothetical protein